MVRGYWPDHKPLFAWFFCRVPLPEYVRRQADIMTMAVGLIVHGDRLEQVVRENKRI
ncbi:hypothetical protein JQ604_32070 [Bradyrhizobium jicamae]|uniref:hypothetical protein n=1 Tax=Bradyrhizobium jicamae TaxID=280332 RepID=UPI001BAA3136|nr:hypothetical protein [Bradyrhizobium jicamae]MBR0756841.1 hypothetical protein [Bradyrhizobium jicamae]